MESKDPKCYGISIDTNVALPVAPNAMPLRMMKQYTELDIYCIGRCYYNATSIKRVTQQNGKEHKVLSASVPDCTGIQIISAPEQSTAGTPPPPSGSGPKGTIGSLPGRIPTDLAHAKTHNNTITHKGSHENHDDNHDDNHPHDGSATSVGEYLDKMMVMNRRILYRASDNVGVIFGEMWKNISQLMDWLGRGSNGNNSGRKPSG